MAREQRIQYRVIGRAEVADSSDLRRHYLRLLYRGDGTPWWCCSSGMELPIPEEFAAKPGDMVSITISVDDDNG